MNTLEHKQEETSPNSSSLLLFGLGNELKMRPFLIQMFRGAVFGIKHEKIRLGLSWKPRPVHTHTHTE